MTAISTTITTLITPLEKVTLISLAQQENISLSQMVRDKLDATIDIQGWAQAAETALGNIIDPTNTGTILKKMEILNRIRSTKRLQEQARVRNDTLADNAYDQILKQLNAQYEQARAGENPHQTPRTARIVGRFTYPNHEVIIKRAKDLKISASDYLRMVLFGYEPGTSDSHLSRARREQFYRAVIHVAENGWTPTSDGGDRCPRCHFPLR